MTPSYIHIHTIPQQQVAYVCSRCQARVADLPTACNVCSLPLVRTITIPYHTFGPRFSLALLINTTDDHPSYHDAAAPSDNQPRRTHNTTPPPLTHTPQPLQVSSSHLARSYHHLFPVPPYKEVPANESPELDACHGCQRRLDVASSKVSELKWIG